jgi:hypothetical protein
MDARLFIAMTAVVCVAGVSYAWPFRARAADRNRDGRVDAKERSMDARVNTPAEARADKDHDGIVEPAEARHARKTVNEAAVVNRPWEAKADLNHDGKVDTVELRKFHRKAMDTNNDGIINSSERHAFWTLRKSKVNTPAEAKYDRDGDGFLTGDEARQFLRDRAILVASHGKAKVSNPLEAEFDADHDGLIDPAEAAIMKDTVGDL